MVALSLLVAQSISSGSVGCESSILVQRAITRQHGIKNHLFIWGDPPPISEESYGGKLPFTMVDSELATVMPKKPGDVFIVDGEELLAIEVHPNSSVVAISRSSVELDIALK